MKTILITLDDEEFEEAKKRKDGQSWRDFFLKSIGVDKK